LLRGVRDVVFAADDVRDAHFVVIHHRREVIERRAQVLRDGDVAEERRVEARAAVAEDGQQGHAEGEGGGGDDADRGVGADPVRPGDPVDRQCRGEAPDAGAEDVADADHAARREAAEDRVREAVPDVAHPAQDHVDPHQAAERTGQRRDDDRLDEEAVAERLPQHLPHGPVPRSGAVRAAGGVAVEDDRHAQVLEHVHRSTEGLLEDLGGHHVQRGAATHDGPVQRDEVGHVRGHAVEVVGGEDDRHPLVVQVAEQVEQVAFEAWGEENLGWKPLKTTTGTTSQMPKVSSGIPLTVR